MAVQISVKDREEVVRELAILAEDLGVDLTPGNEGMFIEVAGPRMGAPG